MRRLKFKKDKIYKYQLKCKICKKSFYVTKFYTKVYTTCSKKCENKYKSIKARGEKNPFYGKKHSEEFKNWQSKRVLKQFQDKTKHPRWKGGKPHCKDCNKEISYVGQVCVKCLGKRQQRENNPFWKGGKSAEFYPFEYNQLLRRKIKQRDDFKCQFCGCPEEECIKGLHIHHIDYDKKNNIENNLISLCPICHCKTRIIKQKKYWKNYFESLQEVRKDEDTIMGKII